MNGIIETAVENPSAAPWIVAIITLMVLYSLLNAVVKLAIDWLQHRKGNGMQGTIKDNTAALIEVKSVLGEIARQDPPPYPACHYDPDHFKRIERVDIGVESLVQFNLELDKRIAAGDYGCRVRGAHLETIQKLGYRLDKGETI